MKISWVAALAVAVTVFAQTSNVPGLEQERPLQLVAAPFTVDLAPSQALPPGSRIEVQSLDPKGNWHPVRDLHGQGQWSIEALSNGRMLQIAPSPSSYAGPLQVKVDGQVVSRYGELVPSSSDLVLEKVLTARASDGTALKVHFTDFTLEKSEDRTYPHRILTHMTQAYEALNRELKLGQNPTARSRSIEAYIGDAEPGGILPFGGFGLADFKRAPLFMIRTDEVTGVKTPVLLLPANYKKFLNFWNQINRVPRNPAGRTYTEDQYLATSVMHEMTHAVIHGFNENLGSTEHEARGGDWYTEGLARYFECKAGSDAGFASEGFRKIADGQVQFSRGGANYYLRYPDENFFSLRYENSLFWMYFEKSFGADGIVRISRELKDLGYAAAAADYARVLSEAAGKPFEDLLNDYFNWVYRGDYRKYTEGARLLGVAAAQSIWSNGQFYTYWADGGLAESGPALQNDWVASWGSAAATRTTDNVAGDWTREADIRPLAFDAHRIVLSAGPTETRTVVVRNTGASQNLRATVYLESRTGIRTESVAIAAGASGRFSTEAHERVTRVGVMLANLDLDLPAAYQITIE